MTVAAMITLEDVSEVIQTVSGNVLMHGPTFMEITLTL